MLFERRGILRAAVCGVLLLVLVWLAASAPEVRRSSADTPLTFNHTFPAGWALVSVPLQPQDPAPAAVFDEVPSPLPLYEYKDGDTLTAGDPGFPSVLPGRAHWLALSQETTVSVTGSLVPTAQSFSLPLTPGWNPIASPWAAPAEWTDSRISITNAGSTVPLSQAASSGWIEPDLSLYDTASGAYSTAAPNLAAPGKLVPWEGGLVFSNIEGTLTFSPPPFDDTPPVAELTAPAADSELTTAAPVTGTASDANLLQYTLEYGVAGTDQFTSFAGDTTSVVNGTLGAFDPTLLADGIYTVRLTAVDVAGNTSTAETTVLVTGSNKPGIFTITFRDLEVPVSGIPITIERTYDSRERGTSGDFGFGWSLSLKSGKYTNNRKPGDGWSFTRGVFGCTATQATKSHITEVRFSDVEFYRFALQVTPAGLIAGGCFGNASFAQIGGVPGATLEFFADPELLWLVGGNQLLDQDTFETFEPQDVRLTTADGRVFDLNLTQGLTALTDPNGNSLSIGPGGVVHSSGKSVAFTRDGSGHTTRITDPEGNAINYSYNGQGDLVTVKDRAGSETTFAYQAGHFLTTIQDPLGNTPLRTEYNDEGRVVAYIDASGNRTEITTDLNANATSITDRLGNITAIQYNDDGLVTEASSGGRTFQMAYDDRDNLLTRTDPLGNTHTFTYDSNNNLTSESDPLGNTTAYAYDPGGHLTSMTDASGATSDLTYDARGNLLEIKDESGLTTMAAAYDAAGNPTAVTTLGGTNAYTYDAFGNVTALQGAEGSISLTYDANGNKLTETRQRTVAGVVRSETTRFTYDDNGRVRSITDPLGNATAFIYDAGGNLSSETDARANTTASLYDARGNLIRKNYCNGTHEAFSYDLENRKTGETDRSGRTTFLDYDTDSHLTRTLFPDGTSVVNAYDARGSLTSTRDERGETTTFEYDDAGRRTRVTDPLGEQVSFTYGSGPAPTTSTDPLGHVTQFEYDLSNFGAPRLSKTIFPDATTRHRTYAASGRLASETDEAGNITLFEYDGVGHLVEVTAALGNVTSYAYDEAGNRIRQTDAKGQATTSQYDANGRVTRRTLPLGMSESFTHDAVGNVVSHTDFNGSTTTFEYDCANQLTRKTYPDSSAVTYTYTPVGQLASVTDARGTTTYAYDVRDRLTTVNNPGSADLTYTYDAAGNRTSVVAPSGTTQDTYDAVNRLVSVTAPDADTTTFTYDAAGNRTQDALPNGTKAEYTYDALNRLTKLENLRPDLSAISSYSYTLGATGSRTKVVENTGRTVDYTYDALYRLTQEQITDAVLGNETTSYAYDAAGNRLSKTASSGTTNYTYDANDRLLTAGGTTFTFDANGNTLTETTGGSTTTYTYDFEDRLASASSPGSAAAYVYDDDGIRVQSTVDGTVTSYTVDKNRDFAQVLEERDGAGALQGSYVYGSDLISQTRGATKSYYQYDGLGSTRALTNASASPTDSYTYDAFGNLLGSTGTTINNYRFAGEQTGPGSSLYYLRARYMAPQLGRFITTDPFLGLVNDPATLHQYSYAKNDPVNHVDPSGEFESLSSLSTGQFMQSALSNLARFYVLSAAANEMVDKLNKQLAELKAIHGMPLNKSLTAEGLRQRIINVNIGLGGIDVELDPNLGGGAVGKAFGIVDTLVGGTPGKIIAFMHAISAASWMIELPETGSAKKIPGGYRNCEFNSYVAYMYQYQLVAGVASPVFKVYTQAIGAYLAYFNVIELAGATVFDMAYGVPSPPNICPGAGS